jgi:hypothetical protein
MLNLAKNIYPSNATLDLKADFILLWQQVEDVYYCYVDWLLGYQ